MSVKKKSSNRKKAATTNQIDSNEAIIQEPSTKQRKKIVPIADLTLENAIEELKSLNIEINGHDELYYNQNIPTISDKDYDKLLRRAKSIIGRFDSLSSLIDHFSRVGSGTQLSSEKAFVHSTPMLSLDNAFDDATLTKVLQRISSDCGNATGGFVLEPKIDGLSLSLIYKNYKLARAGTRGDGMKGEDVTAAVIKYIHQIPQKLIVNECSNLDADVEVRGEVFISRNDFLKMNEMRALRNLTLFSTARNAAAGSLRKLNFDRGTDNPREANSTSTIETDDNYLRLLNFFAYSILKSGKSAHTSDSVYPLDAVSTQGEVLTSLSSLGFQVAKPIKVIGVDQNQQQSSELIKEAVKACQHFEDTKDEWSFDADGVVVKVSNNSPNISVWKTFNIYPSHFKGQQFSAAGKPGK